MKPALRLAFLPLTLVVALHAAETQSAVTPKTSPFVPSNAPTAQADVTNETYELAGVSAVGKRTDLIVYDKGAKKSVWVALGQTKDGISAISYDPKREQAVIKVNGAEKTIGLRKTTAPVNTPASAAPVTFNQATPAPVNTLTPLPLPQAVSPAMPPPASVAPAPAPVPDTPEAKAQAQARAETEARMLVSDLLEIGMAQRKAYEEAQRKAAQGTNAQQRQPAPAAPKQ